MTLANSARTIPHNMTPSLNISKLALPQGGEIALCRMPGAHGDLAGDVLTIAQLDVACVVTLTPWDELHRAGGSALPAALGQRGIAWHHFPVTDFGAPAATQAPQWQQLAKQLHAQLDQGQRILVHCFAGRGRSGMVAMRLLVERGIGPAQALGQVRAVRAGAVERRAQFDWAAGQIDVPGWQELQ